MSICIQNCVRCSWLWCSQQSNQRWIPLTKDHLICALMFSLLLAWANFWNNSRFAGVEKHHMLFRIYFHQNSKFTHKCYNFLKEINYDNNLINFSLRSYVLSSSLLGRPSRTKSYLFSLKMYAHRFAIMGGVGLIHWYPFRRHTSHAIYFDFARYTVPRSHSRDIWWMFCAT